MHACIACGSVVFPGASDCPRCGRMLDDGAPIESEAPPLLTMPQIGAVLGITSRTVAFHKYRAMEALGVGSSAELVAHAVHVKLN
jgi:hypothetical protein